MKLKKLKNKENQNNNEEPVAGPQLVHIPVPVPEPVDAHESVDAAKRVAVPIPTIVFTNQQPRPSKFEEFVRLKLTENLSKKALEAKKRKQVTDNVDDILTLRTTLKILKEKEMCRKENKDGIKKERKRFICH